MPSQTAGQNTLLRNKQALVTGATGTLGSAIARNLAAAGAHVFIHFKSNAKKAALLVKEICDQQGRATSIHADLGSQDDVAQMMKTAGTLDILVNNAGIFPTAPLLDMTEKEWREMFQANSDAVFYCTQKAAQLMKAAGGGSIINIASISGSIPGPHHSHYNSSKAAVIMFTRSAAQELGPYNIRVNSISPGLINRPGLDQDWPEGVAAWRNKAPLTRLGEPADVADACLFLAGDSARWITGQDLAVDGGMSAAPIY